MGCVVGLATLPSGTVTLLFSDIEGSTRLLSRLGAAYAEALDGQRGLLRAAWDAHGGTELGTEGDSFYVVFPAAQRAVAAAAEAQRNLDVHPWPSGDDVRVRIGIHTGSPVVHDNAYVGMDVHRAARIASAAHGGQVVVSAATAELVDRGLPDGVTLRDLGRHHLKDLPAEEHLFQLVVDGVRVDFPPVKSLGSATSLPAQMTPLVGRDEELAELDRQLRTPGVRLLTLTGPGGSGKTRLAIALAQTLVDAFPDGAYFVPLAPVTAQDAIWSTIGEMLDLPTERHTPPRLLEDLAHRNALLVLDNLEQLAGADSVVSRLLTRAPDIAVIATSRRPLHIAGEHEHAVPPLELPLTDALEDVARAGAVQLFVQHARSVRPAFELDVDNAADVAAVCRRLDGLPLAMELAASRTKLLSPRALLGRLDTALDIAATGTGGPRRQKTLRDTIAWSYELLTTEEQRWFRQMGVFAGGADLQAVGAVLGDSAGVDALDVVATMLDASLVTVSDSVDGEPRISMLETVRAFALDQLAHCDELEEVCARHARHLLHVVESMFPLVKRGTTANAQTWFETEDDNIRAALGWALQTDDLTATDPDRVAIGVRLCVALGEFWVSGYWIEGRFWLGRAIELARPGDRPELAECLSLLARCLDTMGEFGQAEHYATASIEMCRRLPGEDALLVKAIRMLAVIEENTDRLAQARPRYEEALAIARRLDDKPLLHHILGYFSSFEGIDHDEQRSMALGTEAIAVARDCGDTDAVLVYQHNLACSLRLLGRVEDAAQLMSSLVPDVVKMRYPAELTVLAEDYAAIVAELGDHRRAARLLAAADVLRDRLQSPRPAWQEEEIGAAIDKARAALSAPEWAAAYQSGLNTPVENVLVEAVEATRTPR
jgi:predicted ATPase/class 3 adenylate cyclase